MVSIKWALLFLVVVVMVHPLLVVVVVDLLTVLLMSFPVSYCPQSLLVL
jgi:hypothetical protein